MIKILIDKYGLKRGEEFTYRVDEDKVILTQSNGDKIAKLTPELFNKLKFKHYEENIIYM
jgi:hypothetical protein